MTNALSKDSKEFCKNLLSAAREIRAEELGLEDTFSLTMDGDTKARENINQVSLRPVDFVFEQASSYEYIPKHLENLSAQKEAVLWRGTRLPSNSSSFEVGGIHTSVMLDVASGYAGGLANSSTGVGRILKEREIGFVTSYKVALDTPTWKNFEYEDYKSGKVGMSQTTLNDLQQDIQSLSKKPASEYFTDEHDAASGALKQWLELAHKRQHYEVVLPTSHEIEKTYLRSSSGFIEVDMKNPKWDKLLARVQEASLRDFYEIKPLEDMLEVMKNVTSSEKNTPALKDIHASVTHYIDSEIEKRKTAPWTLNSMNDVDKWTPSHIKNSNRVGSGLDNHSVQYDEKIQTLQKMVNELYFGQSATAEKFFSEDLAASTTTKITNKIASMREKAFQTTPSPSLKI